MKKNIDRREFFKTAGSAALAMSAVGCARGSQSNGADAEPAGEIQLAGYRRIHLCMIADHHRRSFREVLLSHDFDPRIEELHPEPYKSVY
jgi:hypothetical protein